MLSPRRTDIEEQALPELSSSDDADDNEVIEKELFLRFEIEDMGIGMSEEAMQALFSPFKQNQRLAGGTGLGLFSLAKRIDATQGHYGVQNRRDGEQGSLFWFAFPYKADEVLASLQAQQNFGASAHGLVGRGSFVRSTAKSLQRHLMTTLQNIQLPLTSSASYTSLTNLAANTGDHVSNALAGQLLPITPTSMKSAKIPTNSILPGNVFSGKTSMHLPKALDILVVDDSPAIIKMTRMMLTRMGHHMYVADNGASAVKMVRDRWTSHQSTYDVILMDLQISLL
jgi:hypothetical protein